LSKVIERVLSHKLHQYLKKHNVLYAAQHRFVKGRSTFNNVGLLESLNDWTLILQSKQQTTVIYVDFSYAFDTVSHDKLFARLHSYGICGFLLFIYINELIKVLEQYNIEVKLFADVVKLYVRVLSDIDNAILQCALNALAEWTTSWQLLFLSISAVQCP